MKDTDCDSCWDCRFCNNGYCNLNSDYIQEIRTEGFPCLDREED